MKTSITRIGLGSARALTRDGNHGDFMEIIIADSEYPPAG